ncbi:hypothetical protein PENSPDRAFT_679420 [Peniophora sp. CONT]|nr:hypothetical protein PENSPDRAFT_679420 [Peniophora sp. CONT]
MAAPTQEYPPWLSLSATILTNDQGVPTATAETVLRLPLTYYGPPPEIPLGTDGAWVYGGLTSPAPGTSTTATTTPTPTTTTTTPAIPSSSTSPSASAASTSSLPSSSAASSSSAVSSGSSSVPSSSSSSLPASSSASPSSTTTAAAAGSSSHSNLGRILGLALGITGGLVLLFILIALCVFCRRRRARRRGGVSPTGDALWQWHPIDTDEAHEHDAAREPGEGSPRGSGEEHDPFLRPSVAGVAAAESLPREKDNESTPPRLVGPSQRNASSTSAGLPFASGLLSWGRRNKAPKLDTDEKSGSEQYFDAETGQLASPVAGNNGSGGANRRSVVFANIPPTPPRSSTPARDRHIIPRDVLMRMYPDSRPATPRSRPATPRSPRSPPPLGMNSPPPQSAFEDDSDDYDTVGVPLLPPRLIPSRSRSNYSMRTGRSSRSMGSEHEATVHTARRVRLDEHAMARALPTERYDDDVEAMAQRSWARRVGLHTDAFRDLVDNHGWLRSLVGRGSGRGSVPPSPMPSLDSRASHHGAWTGSDSPPLMPYRSRSHSRSRPNSYAGGVLAAIPDSDVSSSHGHALDPVREARLSPAPPRLREMGLVKPAMTRPVSGATVGSAKSSDTVFYDAPSRFGTPVQGGTMSSGGSRTAVDIPPVPPLPTATTAPLRIRSRDGMRPRGGSEPPAYESLQMPASTYSPTFHTPIDDLNDEPPRPVSPFATASTATAHSRPTIPSSLAMPTVAAWNRSGSNSPSPRDSGMGSQELITIDVLEEAPPEAGVNWNLLRRTEDTNARRTTFGAAGPATILTASRDNVHASLEPSLHSPSPTGQFLTAHTPRDGSGSHSSGSASTRAHSHEQSGSSGQTGSVSSHGHRLAGAASPPLSAVGHRHRISDISSRMNSRPTSASPAPHPVPNASVGSSVTTHQSVRDARTGEILRFPFVPSTAGLSTTREDEGERLRGGDGRMDRDEDEESFGWGGSWGGPEHLRMLQSSGSGGSM